MDLAQLKRLVLRCGTELHLVTEGTGSSLVFVHGGFGDWRTWEPQWQFFASKFRCTSYSRRYSMPNNNGPVRDGHSVHVEAADLQEVIKGTGSLPAVVVGTSYGAYTALALALSSPSSFRALVIAEPPLLYLADRRQGGLETRLEFESKVMRAADQAFRCGHVQRAVEILTNGINGSTPNASNTPGGLARRVENSLAMRSLLYSAEPFPQLDDQRIAGLEIPTLLLAGANTLPIHRLTYEALCQVMPQAHQALIPRAGHGAHRDNPDEFNSTVAHFLSLYV